MIFGRDPSHTNPPLRSNHSSNRTTTTTTTTMNKQRARSLSPSPGKRKRSDKPPEPEKKPCLDRKIKRLDVCHQNVKVETWNNPGPSASPWPGQETWLRKLKKVESTLSLNGAPVAWKLAKHENGNLETCRLFCNAPEGQWEGVRISLGTRDFRVLVSVEKGEEVWRVWDGIKRTGEREVRNSDEYQWSSTLAHYVGKHDAKPSKEFYELIDKVKL